MVKVREGQCGLCQHFGQHEGEEGKNPQILEILSTQYASEDFLADCGQEQLSAMHLRVTPVSGCDGFDMAH